MESDSTELALTLTAIAAVVAAICLAMIVEQLAKFRTAFDKKADRTAKADDLIVENLEAILWQTTEIRKRLSSIDERVSRFSQNQHEQFIGELKDFLDENSVPLDKEND